MMRSMKYFSLFLWVGGAVVLYGIYTSYGLPHGIFSYTFLDNGERTIHMLSVNTPPARLLVPMGRSQ